MPFTTTANVTAGQNQQPEYPVLWYPFQITPASTVGVNALAAATSPGWQPGVLLTFMSSGVGTNPGPGGDGGTLATPYTVEYVDLAPVNSTVLIAGILLGVGTLGAALNTAQYASPSVAPGPLIAMVGVRGHMQVFTDSTSTIGHTIKASATSGDIGCCVDSGSASTFTYGTEFGIVRQAVTIGSSIPALMWAKIDVA